MSTARRAPPQPPVNGSSPSEGFVNEPLRGLFRSKHFCMMFRRLVLGHRLDIQKRRDKPRY
jgi:hypothetical protein